MYYLQIGARVIARSMRDRGYMDVENKFSYIRDTDEEKIIRQKKGEDQLNKLREEARENEEERKMIRFNTRKRFYGQVITQAERELFVLIFTGNIEQLKKSYGSICEELLNDIEEYKGKVPQKYNREGTDKYPFCTAYER